MSPKNEKLAYEMGYRVIDGIPFSYTGRELKINLNDGYEVFDITFGKRSTGDRRNIKIFVHRMVAYQEFGDEIYDYEVVRHLDENSLNNNKTNLALGSHADNRYDMPASKRMHLSINAATKSRRFTDDEMVYIRKLKKEGWTHRELMDEFDISSKGTLWYILNVDYVTKK